MVKVKNRLIITCILFVFLTSYVFAACPEVEEDCKNEFLKNPTGNNFDRLSNPTTDDFDRLNEPTLKRLKTVKEPTLKNFEKLNVDDQAQYLLSDTHYRTDFAQSYLKTNNFKTPETIVIGDKFFSDTNNLNEISNRQSRLEYFNAKGYEFIQFDGQVGGFIPASETLYIQEGDELKSKDLGVLKSDYKFKIDNDGKFYLIPKHGAKEHIVTGNIFSIENKVGIEGTVNGVPINGRDVIIYDWGFETSKAIEINGFRLADSKYARAAYRFDDNSVYFENVRLEEMPYGNLMNGKNVEIPQIGNLASGSVVKKSNYGLELGKNTIFQTVNLERITARDFKVNLYVNDPNFNTAAHNNENYYFTSSNSIISHTLPQSTDQSGNQIGGGRIEVEYLPGNKFFDMTINRGTVSIKNYRPDNQQGLFLGVYNGDVLYISNRQESDKIPEIIRTTASGGQFLIVNGRLPLLLDESNFFLTPKIQSYAGALGYDIVKRGQFKSVPLQIKTENGEYLRINSGNQYVYFKEGEQRAVLYNDFGIPVSESLSVNRFRSVSDLAGKYPNIKFTTDPKLTSIGDVDPSIIQILDKWITDNPEAVNKIKKIEFNTQHNAFADPREPGSLGFGEKALDPYTLAAMPIRKNTVFSIITHEFEHAQDHIITEEEKMVFAGLVLGETKEVDLSKPEYRTLNDVYADVVVSAYNKLAQTEEFRQVMEEIENRHYGLEYAQFIRKGTFKEGDVIRDTKATQPGVLPYLQEALSMSTEELDRKLDITRPLSHAVFAAKFKVVQTEKGAMATYRVPGEEMPGYVHLVHNYLNLFGQIYPEYEGIRRRMDDAFQKHSELPYIYGLQDYSEVRFFEGFIPEEEKRKFSEASATFAELSLEDRRRRIQNGNEAFKKLTQINFDAGKMKVEEYKYLMGQDFCGKPDCCDKKCIIYQLNCVGAC